MGEEMLKSREDLLKETMMFMSAPDIINVRKQCARLCLNMGSREKEIEAIYHLSETLAITLRREALRQLLDKPNQPVNTKPSGDREKEALRCLSLEYGSAELLLQRLKEMPSEWTVVQLTRELDPIEDLVPRPATKAASLGRFHLVRLPCGSSTTDVPVCLECSWPEEYKSDPITVFHEVRTKWANSKSGAGRAIIQMRKEASELAENYCMDLATASFGEWRIATLGKLVDRELEDEIRMRLDRILKKSNAELSCRQRYLLQLIAEGSPHLSEEEIEIGIMQISNDRSLIESVYYEVLNIKKNSQLSTCERQPVILILEDHLDGIPWESSSFMKNHPYCRMPSVHFIHYGFNLHKHHIRNGLVEVEENGVCFYVVNPDNDLNADALTTFFKNRFPSWVGVVNHPPTSEQILDALQKYRIFTYCGHGNGSQYLQHNSILKLNIASSLQFLFGCSSGALNDLGGEVEMTGHVLNYIAAGSGCAIGMLWSVTNKDADAMTMELVSRLLSTPSKNPKANQPNREPELLRALKFVRESVSSFSNGAALIARGLPLVVKQKKLES
ncbi:separase [Nesidiocoris tenuis]|uniref:separase n=1 Tax=Nesidiocoris tenuis TaxID=355587 RepID=A0ABN7AU38_9HEMI|nr:separase [Nesidiocoris tenuis]